MKGGIFLESLGRLSVVLIDKTGTLTEGRFRLVGLEIAAGSQVRKTPSWPTSRANFSLL